MVNLALAVVIFYYLVRTGDLFKLIKIGRKLILDLLFTLRKEKQGLEVQANPIEILKLRYVKGEISQKDYEMIVKNL